MDINKKMQEVTDKVIEEKLSGIIETQITSTVEDIIKDSFRSYSDFGKQMKEAIEQKMNVSFENLQLINYNQFIIETIENELTAAKMQAVEPLKNAIAEIVGVFDKEEIKISEIFDKFKEEVVNDAYDDSGEFTFMIEKSEKYGWHSIYFDPEADQDRFSCKFEFTIHKDGHVHGFRYKHWTASDLKKVTPSVLSQFHNFEKYLFRVFNSKVKVVIDESYFETEWYKYED